jgi:hypothetical protein
MHMICKVFFFILTIKIQIFSNCVGIMLPNAYLSLWLENVET